MIFTLSFVDIFAFWLKRERNPLWACWNTGGEALRDDPNNGCEGDYRVFGSAMKMPAKEANYFDVFLHAIYIETSGSTLKKKCCLVKNLNYSLDWNAVEKICKLVQKEKCSNLNRANFPSSHIIINFWVGGGGWESTLWLFEQKCSCDSITLSFYHSMFSCNSAALAIL